MKRIKLPWLGLVCALSVLAMGAALNVTPGGMLVTPTAFVTTTFLPGTNIILQFTNGGRQVYVHGLGGWATNAPPMDAPFLFHRPTNGVGKVSAALGFLAVSDYLWADTNSGRFRLGVTNVAPLSNALLRTAFVLGDGSSNPNAVDHAAWADNATYADGAAAATTADFASDSINGGSIDAGLKSKQHGSLALSNAVAAGIVTEPTLLGASNALAGMLSFAMLRSVETNNSYALSTTFKGLTNYDSAVFVDLTNATASGLVTNPFAVGDWFSVAYSVVLSNAATKVEVGLQTNGVDAGLRVQSTMNWPTNLCTLGLDGMIYLPAGGYTGVQIRSLAGTPTVAVRSAYFFVHRH